MAEVKAVATSNSKFGMNLYNKIKQENTDFLLLRHYDTAVRIELWWEKDPPVLSPHPVPPPLIPVVCKGVGVTVWPPYC
jgi:hypothetical protein